MSKVTVLAASSPSFWPVMQLTAPNRVAYCLRHGYELLLRVHRNPTESFFEEREVFMLEALRTTDWLLFMGADTCFTNFKIEILQQLVGADKPDVVYGVCAPKVSGIVGLNNDVMLLRNCPATVDFLTEVIRLKPQFCNDQAAMKTLLDKAEANGGPLQSKPLPQKLLNSMPQWLYRYNPAFKNARGIWEGQWEPGDFIFHAPGLSVDARLKVISEVLGQVIM